MCSHPGGFVEAWVRRHIARGDRCRHGDEGSILIEAVVAMSLAAIFMISLTFSLSSGLRSVRTTKQFQQATAIGTDIIERSRNLAYEGLYMLDADVAGDPLVTSGKVDPDGAGPLSSEPVVSSSGGTSSVVNPHVTTETIGNERYVVSRYVTWVDDTTQGGPARNYKRLTTIVKWTTGSASHSYTASTFITKARRGLPIPKFNLTPLTNTITVAPGNQAVIRHAIQNLGITDAYDIVMPPPAGRLWTIRLYGSANEVYDVTDALLLDTNGSGVVDTGSVGTGQRVYVFAVWTLASTEPTAEYALPFAARSGANAQVFKMATDKIRVRPAGLSLWLHANPAPGAAPTGDMSSVKNASMNSGVTPTATTLFLYSQEQYGNRPGRFVDKSAAVHTEGSVINMVNWVYQIPTSPSATFTGTAVLSIWVTQKDHGCAKAPRLNVFIRERTDLSSDAGTVFGSATVDVAPPANATTCPPRLATLTIPVTRTIDFGRYLELKIAVDNASGDPALFAYDTTAHPAELFMPQVSL